MNIKNSFLVTLFCASLLSHNTVHAVGFGTLFSGIGAVWAVLPKRALLLGTACAVVAVKVGQWLCKKPLPEALRGQICPICQEEFKDGDNTVTCRNLFHGGEDGDKHGFHRDCILNTDGSPKCGSCPICRATPNPAAARATQALLLDHVNERDGFAGATGATDAAGPHFGGALASTIPARIVEVQHEFDVIRSSMSPADLERWVSQLRDAERIVRDMTLREETDGGSIDWTSR